MAGWLYVSCFFSFLFFFLLFFFVTLVFLNFSFFDKKLGENRHWHKYYFRISFDYGVLTYFKSSNEDRFFFLLFYGYFRISQ